MLDMEQMMGNIEVGSDRRKTRIAWIDVLRGILILLVVLGHATGKYNGVIYQFHIASLFILSGYVENLRKKRLTELVYQKTKRLLLPYITLFFTLLTITLILNCFGLYETIFGMQMPDIQFTIREYFLYGNCYVWWLGACWFLPVLFFSSLLAKLLIKISRKAYFVLSAGIYLIAYLFILQRGITQYRDYDLILIAQFFFCLGFAMKDFRVLEKVETSRYKYGIFTVMGMGGAGTLALIYFVCRYTVDYPSRAFNHFAVDAVMGVAGFLIAMVLAMVLAKTFLKRLLVYIGRNTMGIMMLHFVFMKAVISLLYVFQQASLEDVARIVPTDVTGNSWYVVITVLSVGLSMLAYKGLSMIPGYRVALGLGKNDLCLSFFLNIVDRIKAGSRRLICKLRPEKTKRADRHKLMLILLLLAILVLVSMDQILPRIVVNDELQARALYLKEPLSLLKHDADVKIYKEGRPMAALSVPISNFVGYLGTRSGLFKAVQWLVVTANVIMICYLLYKLIGSSLFIVAFGVFSLMCMPITFEHTSPNAFVTYYGIPLLAIVVSLELFRRYLEKGKKLQLVISLILWFWGMSAYEAFIAFLPAFVLLAFIRCDEKGFFRRILLTLRKALFPILTVVVYVVCYFLLRLKFPSNYTGTDISFTLSGALGIIGQLLLSALPGYYLLNSKYHYLTYIYGHGGNVWLNLQPIHYLLGAILLVMAGLVWYINRDKEEVKKARKGYIWIAIAAEICCVIIAVPNSIASMYQGNVNAESFIALPCSYAMYFLHLVAILAVVFAVSTGKIGHFFKFGACLVLCVIGLLVQIDNHLFALEQHRNYQRIEDIENLIRSETFQQMDGKTIYAPDLYQQKNALFIHDGYWTEFASAQELNTRIESIDQQADIQIDFVDDAWFRITDLQTGRMMSIAALSQIPKQDGIVGQTLDTCKKEGEIYDDGWIGKTATITILTGRTGNIQIVFYFPFEDEAERLGTITWSDQFQEKQVPVRIESKFTSITLECTPETVIQVHMDFSAFAMTLSQNDERELSVILNNISGE